MAKFEGLTGGKFPVLRERLDFGKFHKSLAGNYVDVWLNLDEDFNAQRRKHRENYALFERRRDVLVEGINSGRFNAKKQVEAKVELAERVEAAQVSTAELYARMWDCSVEEYRGLASTEGAGGLLAWLFKRTWDMVTEYQTGRTKAPSD